MIRGSLGIATIVTACALLGLPTKAAAWCQTAVDYDAMNKPFSTDTCMDPTAPVRLHWTRKCLSYSIDDKGSTDPGLDIATIEGVAAKAFGAWTSILCPVGGTGSPGFQVRETTELSQCDQAQYNSSGGNVNTIAFLDAAGWQDRKLDGLNTTYALTTVWHDTVTGEILDADMLINENMGPYTVCPADPTGCPPSMSARSPVDLQNVMTHEAGHYFGLAHSQLALDPQNQNLWPTMTVSATRDATFMRTPAPDDISGFCTIYPPPATPPVCASNASFLPNGGLRLACAKSGGGCSIGGAPGTGGRTSLAWLIAAAACLLALRRRRRYLP